MTGSGNPRWRGGSATLPGHVRPDGPQGGPASKPPGRGPSGAKLGIKRFRRRNDRQVLALVIGSSVPGSFLAMALLWTSEFPRLTQISVSLLVVGLGVTLAVVAWERIVYPLHTLANLVAGVREGDFSVRAGPRHPDDPLGLAYLELNALADLLQEQRLAALDAAVLARRVMAEIEDAVIAIDEELRVRLVNRAAADLLGLSPDRIVGSHAAEVGLGSCLNGRPARTLEHEFPGGAGQWRVRRTTFRQGGVLHHLLVLSDLTKALREQERQAWKRLIRVLSHEINNSLVPILSIVQEVNSSLMSGEPLEEWGDEASRGLTVVERRATALGRFMASYAKLARLPPPERKEMCVETWVRRIVELERRMPVVVLPSPPVRILADPDQLDQLLINLVKNAVDAALETGGKVRVAWDLLQDSYLEVIVEDDGPGIADPANLFVPFFTTKPNGSGIGLVFSRQVAEAHQGTLDLWNRGGGRGCTARLRLPLSHPESPAGDRASGDG